MNNKYIGIIVAVLVLGLGGLWFTMRPAGDSDREQVIESTPNPQTTGVSMDGAAEVVTFDITGEPFKFSQTEIKVKKGDTVKINFQSTKGTHDLVIDEFNVATKQVDPGEVTSVEFVAEKTGEFEYYCSIGNHRSQGMVGKLIVE